MVSFWELLSKNKMSQSFEYPTHGPPFFLLFALLLLLSASNPALEVKTLDFSRLGRYSYGINMLSVSEYPQDIFFKPMFQHSQSLRQIF